ncbi:MAG: pyridoxal-phosphate dependent enzyme, partial [bacterium]
LITGEFDPTWQKAVWPSTGNYCRGGAYDSYLLACPSIAILPEGMSKERFEWLKKAGSEIIATPGTESNVKEIYDKCWELKRTRGDEVVILNQFDEFPNALWHYEITGAAMEEVFEKEIGKPYRFSAVALTQGSCGTLGAAEYLKKRYPGLKLIVGEALQCPTLLLNGYGSHRIEGIGDKHVPWIFNVKNADVVCDIDDNYTVRLMRLFNEEKGRKFLKSEGVEEEIVEKLDLLGFSGIANLLCAIKAAKYFEYNEKDVIFTVFTDSMELYQSRIEEYRKEFGEYTEKQAAKDFEACLLSCTTDYMLETTYYDRKRIHNLKYFTWVEQQGKSVEELNAQWYDENYWEEKWSQANKLDEKIKEFNEKTG